ncbi:PREDICTED: putative Polycomb group protein ASXL1 [Cyprinodon variegatus]|nr:PREDICTED: putative Polycomb group protein ASXL1 [Cyprinodon variegatus]
MKDKQKRKKERTWAEAARMVLENFSDAPMTPKQILHVIQTKGLKEMRSGTAPLACLVTMLHSQVRGDRVKNSIFFKLPGRMSLFTLKKNALQWTKPASESEAPSESAGNATSSSSSTPVAGSAAPQVDSSETAEQESCDSSENAAVIDNDASVDENSSSASCSTELQAPSSHPQTRLSRAAGQQGRTDAQQSQHAQTRLSRSRQSGRQRKKAVMMPRVVLTPLKVNGEHVSTGPMKRSRGGVDIDFETPGSILVNTNIRALINVRTFSAFPSHSQQQLLQLLPEVDRQVGPDGMARLSTSALNNEFFTHASQSWKERLAEGEFTHEMQVRFRQEKEKEKKVEAWKEKFFEEYHGQKSGLTRDESLKLTVSEASEVAATVLEGDADVVSAGVPKRRTVGRRRRDGRMRRRTRADLRRRARRTLCKASPALPPKEADAETVLDVAAVSVDSPVPSSTDVQGEVVLHVDCGVELPVENTVAEPEASPAPEPTTPAPPTPVPSPSPSTASTSANEELEVALSQLPKEEPPVLASTTSPSSSSSSSSSPASSPASSPSSPDQQGAFTTGLDSSSSSGSSSATVPADHLDDAASVVTSVTGGTVTSSRESSPSASPATTPMLVGQLKEQKRRQDEVEAFSSFPEKRARLNDRRSFRTTIDSVCSEKPQPTTEEPKVPPIRIQLSRIKPPWVKGHPTYQICPRIVPPTECSRRSGTGGARTLADIKARAQQARAQREAAAAASAEGAGPSCVRVWPPAGISDSSSERRSREHPGPVEPGGGGGGGDGGRGGGGANGSEEQDFSSEPNSSGTQLQLPDVEAASHSSPSPSNTSASMSPQVISPHQQRPGGETKVEETADPLSSSNRLTDSDLPAPPEPDAKPESSAKSSPVAESSAASPQTVDPGCEKVALTQTSIPDSFPRFGAHGVDVLQTLSGSLQAKGQDKGREGGVGGVIHHSSHHLDPPGERSPSAKWPTAASSPTAPQVKDEEEAVHSDSTETASDCENDSQEEEEAAAAGYPDPSWNAQPNGQLVICSLPPQNQPPLIQAFLPSHKGQTVIQPRFPKAPPHLPDNHTQDRRHLSPPVKVEPGEDGSKESSAEGELSKSPIAQPNGSAAAKRPPQSARAVSSVEANNPLVTQLLQGSLPLEKVLPPHSATRLAFSLLPPQRPTEAAHRSDSSAQCPTPDLTRSLNKSPTSHRVSGAADVSQLSAVPVITSLPSSLSKSTPLAAVESRVIKECGANPHQQRDAPDRLQLVDPAVSNGGAADSADGAAGVKLGAPLSLSHQRKPSPAPAVKSETASRPSCQGAAKSAAAVPKKEPANAMDGYLSGGAMEGLLNMEMTLTRISKKEHSKAPCSSGSPSSLSPLPSSSSASLPFQLYGKLPKQGGNGGVVSYTANVSMMDNGGFSRGVADGVLQLRPRLASSHTTLSIQAFTDSTTEEVALKCSCRLKAMIMCQGCGAFCHDDCIGPSKLCVSCLVVR